MENPDKKYEDFVRLFLQAEPGLRGLLRVLLPSVTDVDEVLQETSLVLWKKFDRFEMGTSFSAWASVIARFEVLKYRRERARDRHVFSDEVVELLGAQVVESGEALARERRALQTCLTKLRDTERALVTAVYTRGAAMKEAAEVTGRSVAAAYKALSRIRMALLQCIEREMRKEVA